MNSSNDIGLPEALERAAAALPGDEDEIRPANGDPFALLSLLDAEASQRVLEWLLANEPLAGSELVEAWADAGGEAAALLTRVDGSGLSKQARKALRRAYHRMRSRGESIPDRVEQPIVATLPKVVDEIAISLISGLDPRGTRMAYIVETDPSGGARLFAVAIDDDHGVGELEVFSAGRSKIKAFIRGCIRSEEHPAVEAPGDAVRALIERSAAAQPADRPMPRVFAEWRSRIADPPEGASTPGELVRAALAADDSGEVGDVGRAVAMVRDQSIGPWPPPNETLSEIAQRLSELAEGVVVVSAAAKREQLDRALDEAVDRVFEPGFADRTANRFEETAYVFWRREVLEDARACLAAAKLFRGSKAEFRELGRAMLEVVLAPTLKSIERQPEEAESSDGPSLVVP
jgi:hypothetical protein